MNKRGHLFNAKIYRAYFSKEDPLSTSGSKIYGGRWNRKNIYGAIYASFDKETLKAELIRMTEKRGYRVTDLFAYSVSTLKVQLKMVFDLTDQQNMAKYNLKESDILSDEENSKEKCLKVADKLRSVGYEAIISPSAANPKGKNLNIYPDKLLKKSYIRGSKIEPLFKI